MDPMSMGVGAGLNLVGSIPGLINAIQQGKERKRLLAEGPEGLTPLEYQQMATAQNRANMSQVAGYGTELENINQQQANALGEAKRAGVSSSNMLNALTRLNQQGQAARRNLAIRGAQGQRIAQSELGGLQGVASANLQNRKRYWEKNLADLDTARKQQIAQFATSPFQGAMAGMRYGGGATTPTSGTPAPEMMETGTPPVNLSTYTPQMGVPKYAPTLETMDKPYLDATYQNMFDPNAAARRMNMRSQMLRTSPYYEF